MNYISVFQKWNRVKPKIFKKLILNLHFANYIIKIQLFLSFEAPEQPDKIHYLQGGSANVSWFHKKPYFHGRHHRFFSDSLCHGLDS